MRRFPTGLVIAILSVVTLVVGYRMYSVQESARAHAVQQLLKRPSYIKLVMQVDYPAGRISHEQYTLIDDNGVSNAAYAVTDRHGTTAKFDEPIAGYDVSFAFGKAVQDGIWELNSKHRRALDEVGYLVTVQQTADGGHGTRTFTFTNPEYWARAAGQQYHITLDPKKPTPNVNDILRLQSVSNADPRYLEIVKDFQTFGSAGFKRTVASAREKLLKS
jgi:hypothetical protein